MKKKDKIWLILFALYVSIAFCFSFCLAGKVSEDSKKRGELSISLFKGQLPQELAKAYDGAWKKWEANPEWRTIIISDHTKNSTSSNSQYRIDSPLLNYDTVYGININGAFVALKSLSFKTFEMDFIFEVWNQYDLGKGYQITKKGEIIGFEHIGSACSLVDQPTKGVWKTSLYQYPDIPEDLQSVIDFLLNSESYKVAGQKDF